MAVLSLGGVAHAQIEVPDGYQVVLIHAPSPTHVTRDMTVAPDGSMVFPLQAKSRVPCESSIGMITPQGEFAEFARPCVDGVIGVGFAPGGGDLLYFAERAGNPDDLYTVPPGGGEAERQLFLSTGLTLSTTDIEFSPAGDLYQTDIWNGKIWKIDPDASYGVFASGFSVVPYPNTHDTDLRLEFAADGVLYVADRFSSTIYALTDDGARSVFTTAVPEPRGLAFSDDGSLYVASQNGSIYAVDPLGQAAVFATGFPALSELEFGANGELFVLGQDTIWRIQEAVLSAVDRIAALAANVANLNLHNGITNALDAKLDTALKALDDLKDGNDVAAIQALEAFVNAVQAQSGKEIDAADADILIADAEEIIDLLSGS